MEQIAFKIMAFSLMINFAAGMFGYIGFNFADVKSPLIYNSSYGSGDVNVIEDAIGSAPVENSDNWGDKILDFFQLGLFKKVTTFVNNMLFGFLNIIYAVGVITKDLKDILWVLFTFIYMAGTYELFTGKSILG